MYQIVLLIIVCGALVLSLFIGVYSLFRSQSSKKNYFLLIQSMIIIYLAGYLLEITSANAEQAFTAVRVLYIGVFFVAPCAFFFVADFCNIKIHPFIIKLPMLAISLASVIAMWTTKIHRLFFTDFSFDRTPCNHLSFTPGPLFSLLYVFPALCMILTMGIMLSQIEKWKQKYRKTLIVFFLCLLIPFTAEAVNFASTMAGMENYYINFTPHSLVIMGFCLYFVIVRFNIFEVISAATVSAMEFIKEGFLLVDENNNYLFSNPAAVKMLPEIARHRRGESIFSAGLWPEELKNKENDSVDFSMNGDNKKYFRASISPIFTRNQALMAKIILFTDITDHVALMKELENAAYIDSLTGIYNRKHFYELAAVNVGRATRLNQPIFTAILDLDLFKNINDTYGHAAGDEVIRKTAAIIRNTIRSYDLVGRYGGEEFVLLITDLNEAIAYNLMERIRENMEYNVINYEGTEIRITCSIGLARYTEDDTLESSVNKADKAMYFVKRSKRNQVKIYDSSLDSAP